MNINLNTAAENMRAPPERGIVKWILATRDGSEDGHIHSFKEKQPCRAVLESLKVVGQAVSISCDKDPFNGITKSDFDDAAPNSLIIDASDTEVIDIE